MTKKLLYITLLLLQVVIYTPAQETSGNPLFKDWYADPDATVFEGQYWIYPTRSVGFGSQRYFDAFSSKDLIHWTKHSAVFHTVVGGWYWNAMWAPSVIHENGKYYLYFSANNYIHEGDIGGIGVAVSDHPDGPFKDALGQPLIGKVINGSKPIDQCVFRDDDDQYYMYYGGWHRCTIVKLSKDLIHLEPFPDGTLYKDVTPQGNDYNEGPYVMKRKDTYYLMWSGGSYTDGTYHVSYATSKSPLGPFQGNDTILQQDLKIASGPGHHSVLKDPNYKDKYYIVYHRHPAHFTDGNERYICIDELRFRKDGSIEPVVMTNTGVRSSKIK